MTAGRIVQTRSPIDVHEAPVDAWAARLTGPASEIDAVVVATIGDEPGWALTRARVLGFGAPTGG